MPEFNLIQPLVETIDRRGQNMNVGIGGANTSELGSFLGGFTAGAINMTNLRSKQLETQRLNDPQRLADEAVERDLRNKHLRRIVDLADADLEQRAMDLYLYGKYGEQERRLGIEAKETGIAATRAGTAATRTATRRAQMQADLEEKYGEDLRIAELILKENQDRDSMYGSASKQKGKSSDTLNLIRLQSQIQTSRRTGVTKQHEVYAKLLDSENEAIEGLQTNVDSMRKKLAASSNPTTKADLEVKIQKAEEDLTNKRKRVDQLSSVLQEGRVEPEDINAQQQSLFNMVEGLQREQQTQSEIAGRSVLSNDLYNARKQTYKMQRSSDSVEVGTGYAARATEAANEDRDSMGTPNYPAAIEPILKLSSAMKGDLLPEDQQILEDQMDRLFEDLGGIEQIGEYLESNMRDNPNYREIKKSLLESALRTNNLEAISPDQREMLEAGMNIDLAVDPEKTRQDIATLISGKGSQIPSLQLKMLYLSHPYFEAASRASKIGKQGFMIVPRRLGTQSTGDVSGEDVSQAGVMFIGGDGSEIPAPPISSKQDVAVYSILEKVADTMATSINQNQDAQRMVNDMAIAKQGPTQQPSQSHQIINPSRQGLTRGGRMPTEEEIKLDTQRYQSRYSVNPEQRDRANQRLKDVAKRGSEFIPDIGIGPGLPAQAR